MDLAVVSKEVREIATEYAMTLRLTDEAEIRIETEFALHRPGHTVLLLDPEESSTHIDVLGTLLGRAIERATTDEAAGSLNLEFSSGIKIEVPPHPDYEAWSISWLDGSLAVCLPGGGTRRWGPRP